MAFKIKRKKRVCPPKPEFFREREIQSLRKKHKGKLPSFTEISRTGIRRVSGIHARIYKKGRIVQYKGKLATVEKVTTKGITISPFTKPNGLSVPTKKKVFVSANDVEKGKVYPFFTNFPIVFGGIVTIGRK